MICDVMKKIYFLWLHGALHQNKMVKKKAVALSVFMNNYASRPSLREA